MGSPFATLVVAEVGGTPVQTLRVQVYIPGPSWVPACPTRPTQVPDGDYSPPGRAADEVLCPTCRTPSRLTQEQAAEILALCNRTMLGAYTTALAPVDTLCGG